MSKKIILVTGGAGHIGSNIIEILVKDENNIVISLDNYFSGKTENHIAGAEYRKGHTKDIETLIPENPDIIYHLGEYARISTSFEDIQKVFDMNTVGTFAVLEFCRNRKVGKFVYAGSSTKFASEGNGRNQSPYAFSKAANVDLINNYGVWYNLPYAICYFNNAYGPRENGDGKYFTLIAKFEKLFLKGEELIIVKPGTQKRNFTHVRDLAIGMIMVGEKGSGDGYVLGSTKSYSVEEIAKAFGGPIKYIDGNPGRSESGETPLKAREELGWDTKEDVLEYIKTFVAQHPKKVF